jgi:phage baseplate assembly protein V
MSQIDRLYRRILMMISPVRITATDDTGSVHTAQVRVTTTNEPIDAVPVAQLFGLAGHAPAGSDGVAIFMRGNRSSAMIVATNNQQLRPRNLKSGEVCLYNAEDSTIVLAEGHTIKITGQTITVTADTINLGNGGKVIVNVNGDIHCTGTITADTINADKGHVGP